MGRDFKESIYESLLYSYGRVLSKYNVFAQDTVLKDVGKDILNYLENQGYSFEKSGGEPDLNSIVEMFVQNGLVDDLEIETHTEGTVYKWKNLYGLEAYAELQKSTENPFLACPLNAAVYYAASKHGKTLKLYEKSFDREKRTAYTREDIVDSDNDAKGDGFDPLVIENARLYELAEERAQRLEKQAKELEKQNRELQELNQQVQSLFGILSHDIRSPMVVVDSAVNLLSRMLEEELDDQSRKLLERIKESTNFVIKFSDGLLDASRIESNGINLDLEYGDYLELVKNSIDLNSFTAEEKNIRIVSELSEDIPLFLHDRVRLMQVMNNIIGNAIKFSDPGTEVVIKTYIKDESVWTKVTDKGKGIPKEDLVRLFLPYSKTSVESTAGEKGSGLGLWIVKKIIEAHGGKIDVESETEEGTTFTFSLPLRH